MAKIRIEPSKAKNVLDLEQSVEKNLESFSGDVDRVRGNLRKSISGQEQIDARLKEAVEQLLHESRSTGNLRSGLEQIILQYQRTEDSNIERADPENIASNQGSTENQEIMDLFSWDFLIPKLDQWQSILDKLISVPPGPFTPFIPGIIGVLDLFLPDENGETVLDRIENEYSIGSSAEKDLSDEEFLKDYRKDLHQDQFYIDKDGNIKNVDPNDAEAMEEFKKHNEGDTGLPVDVKFASVGAESSIAFAEGEIGDEYQWGGYEASYSAVEFEGHAEAYVGYGLAGAAIGGSITAFTATERAYLGSEDANLYVESTQTAGRAAAEAEARAGFWDKDGNFDPALYAGASAELIGGEITAKVGGEFAGVDIGAEGSLNWGVGAHANVGLNDGKLSVDIGASLGIGVSVAFEMDFSGAIDAVAENAEDLWSSITSIFD